MRTEGKFLFILLFDKESFLLSSFRRKPESRGKPVNKHPAVYILASKKNGTLYIGVTSDLVKRVWEHKNDLVEGFTKHYGIHQLVWYELHESMESAIQREKRLKEWKRVWKLELIETTNPNWQDLYHEIV
jgi:putative endonuclease